MSSLSATGLGAIVLLALAMEHGLVAGQRYDCLPVIWEVDPTIQSPTCSNFLPSARCCEGLSCESLIGCYPNPRQRGHPCSLNDPCVGDRCCDNGLKCELPPTPIKPNTGLCVSMNPPTKRPTNPMPTNAPTRSPTVTPTELPTSKPPTITPTRRPTPKPTKRPSARPTLRPRNPPTTQPSRRPTREPSVLQTTGAPIAFAPTDSPARSALPTVSPVRAPTDSPPQAPSQEAPPTTPITQPSLRPTSSTTNHPTTAIFANRSQDFDELIYFGPELVGPSWTSEGSEMGPFGRCAGDCDQDSDCRDSLICLQRSGNENSTTIPGCIGTAQGDIDYCIEQVMIPVDGEADGEQPVRFCLGEYCWQQVGSTMRSNFVGDRFGDKVKLDLSGGRFSVSASRSSESGYFESGTVKVYDVEDGNFTRVGQELYGFTTGDRCRGVLSGDGRRLAVYTRKRDNDTGRVWIYELQNGKWVEIWEVTGQSEGERFGSSVALNTDGSIVAVGAPFAYNKQGAVRIYAEQNGNWSQLGTEIVGQFRDGKLGWDVAFASNELRLVAGQKSDDNKNNSGRSGQVQVFQYSGSNVNVTGSFERFGQAILGDNPGDDFGWTVAISASGTVVAAGARNYDGAGRFNSGQIKAHSYFDGDGLWSEIKGSDIIGDNANDQLMTLAMNANGDRIAAGAGQGDEGLGYIRVYDNASTNGWEQIGGKLAGSEDNENFGSDISMSADGKRLLVGSPASDTDSIPARIQLFELVDK